MTLSSPVLVLDLSQLRNVTLNDEALMREVISALVSDASHRIEELQRAVERADALACARLAHSAHGACGNVGAASMAALFGDVERHARNGSFGLCVPVIENLSIELEKLRVEAVSV